MLLTGEGVGGEVSPKEPHIGGIRVDHNARQKGGRRGPSPEVVVERSGRPRCQTGIEILMAQIKAYTSCDHGLATASCTDGLAAELRDAQYDRRCRVGRKVMADARVGDGERRVHPVPDSVGGETQIDGERVAHEPAAVDAEKAVVTTGHMAALTTDFGFCVTARAPLIVGVFEQKTV